LSERLKKMFAASQNAMTKWDEKRRLENEATAAIYINLTKETIEVQRFDAYAKRLDAEAKCRGMTPRSWLPT
jgi:hypothetical protein